MRALSLPASFVGALCALLITAFASPVRADDAANLGQSVGTITVPQGLSRDEVKDIVAVSLAGRQWNVQSKTDEAVVGYLKHRGNEATLTFVLSDTQIQMYCVGYAINKAGERKKPEMPEGWIANLNRDITKRLGMAIAAK